MSDDEYIEHRHAREAVRLIQAHLEVFDVRDLRLERAVKQLLADIDGIFTKESLQPNETGSPIQQVLYDMRSTLVDTLWRHVVDARDDPESLPEYAAVTELDAKRLAEQMPVYLSSL